MDQLEAHQRAQDVFASVLVNVPADAMSTATPCTEWDVAALIDHVIGGNGWVVGLAGGAPPERTGDLMADHAAAAAGAQAVFAAPDGMTRMFALPFAELPGMAFIGLRTTDVLVHAWDLAKATGQPTDLDAELSAEALEASRMRIAPAFRGPGRPFQAEQTAPEGAPVADQLAAFLGRSV